MLKEFREFISRGSVVDLAVGIIIGSAFTAIVNSLVGDIIMPVIGLMLSGVDFSEIVITLREATATSEAVTINIGLFLNSVISFLIVAFSVFLLVKSINRIQKQFEKEQEVAEAVAGPTTEEKLVAVLERLEKKL
jgi:large conductance mechanosensitive channel